MDLDEVGCITMGSTIVGSTVIGLVSLVSSDPSFVSDFSIVGLLSF